MSSLKKFRALVMTVSALFMFCCGSTLLYMPTMEQIDYAGKKWPGVDSAYLLKGHTIYTTKCGSCHYLYNPSDYSVQQWDSLLPEMRDEAKLTDQEYLCLEKYIITMSADFSTSVKTEDQKNLPAYQ